METARIENLDGLRDFAAAFVKTLKGGNVVGLVGELGVGKTAFAQLLARELGVESEVKSPTFVIMHCHDVPARGAAAARGIACFCHADAYRLEGERELRALGFYDFAGRPDTVALVEWADRAPELKELPGYRELRFSFLDGDAREIAAVRGA